MNEILDVDVDLDWLEGLDEPGELIWTDDGWSLADVTIASAVQLHRFMGGLACIIHRDIRRTAPL